MTILDYTKLSLSVSSIFIDDEFLKMHLVSIDLDPADEMNQDKAESVKEALYNLIPIILTSPKSITEGGYSITYDKDSLMNYYRLLAKELDKPDLLKSEQPRITDISNLW